MRRPTVELIFQTFAVWIFVIAGCLSLLFLSSCSTESLTPDKKDVKVSKEEPSKECRELGRVTGSTSTSKGTYEQALQDMIREATEKGANYLKVDSYSSYGGSATGTAYRCP